MPFVFKKHTADLRMVVSGTTLEELFVDAVYGMMAVMKSKKKSGDTVAERNISVGAADTTALLIDFLNDVLTNTQIHKEIYYGVNLHNLTPTSIDAVLHGNTVTEFRKDIKAVTYHEAHVEQNSNGKWETTIVFDI